MIAVFVSKNDEEFERYKAGCPKHIIKNLKHIIKNLRYTPKFSENGGDKDLYNDNDSSSLLSAAFEDVKKQHPEKEKNVKMLGQSLSSGLNEKYIEYMIIPDSILEYYNNETFVVVIRSGDYINQLKQKSIKEAYEGVYAKNLLNIIGDVIKDAVPGRSDDERRSDDESKHDVHLLIHWGNVTDLKAEEDKFNRVINENGYKKFIGCKCLRFHELSSRRPSFNVQGHLIKVPVKKEEVDELLECFNAEREFVDVKDYMTKYLYDPACVQQKMIEFMATKEFRSKIREIAKESKFKWLLGWTSFRDFLKVAEDENAVKKTVADILNASDEDNQEKSRALISQLLSEGIV